MNSSNAGDYRSRLWWIPVTIAVIAAISAVQVALEIAMFGRKTPDGNVVDGRYLAAHAIAFVLVGAAFTAVAAVRRGNGKTSFLPYSERYLVGVGYGFAVSIIISIAYGALAADSAADAVESAGEFMYLSVLSMQLPVACIVGGLTWHLISKARIGSAPPVRARRPIEDPE